MPAQRSLHTRLVKLFYRVVAPRHARGWIDIDWETTDHNGVRIFSEGLDRFNLPNLEITDCPSDPNVLGYLHGMLYVAIAILQGSQESGVPIKSGDTIDIRTPDEEEPARVQLVSRGQNIMGIEDLELAESSFPSSATASYILNSAEKMQPSKAIEAIKLAAKVHAQNYDYNCSDTDDPHVSMQRSNARAYYLMSDALSALGKTDDAFIAAEEAVARSPALAEQLKKDIGSEDMVGILDSYLASIDPWEVQARFRANVLKSGE